MTYAKGTSVDTGRSKSELETILRRFGCDDIINGTSVRNRVAYVVFTYAGRKYKFDIKLPDPDTFRKTDTGRDRANNVALKAYEQAERESWRLLVQMVKMTLLWVESENETFERAFATRLLTSSGDTIGDLILGDIDRVCSGARLPKLLT